MNCFNYTPIVPNFMFAYPWYNINSNNSYNSYSILNQNIEQARTNQLYLQNQLYANTIINNYNYGLIQNSNSVSIQSNSMTLDEIIFPEDPIRDYFQSYFENINKKYSKKIEQLTELLKYKMKKF